jgi:hypothetical protein
MLCWRCLEAGAPLSDRWHNGWRLLVNRFSQFILLEGAF